MNQPLAASRLRSLPGALALLALTACEATAPSPNPPYLAIVAKILAPPTEAGNRFSYRIREVSGTLPVDTVISAAPTDTIIFPVQPATYSVELDGVNPQCRVRDGTLQEVVVPVGINTSLVRYVIDCQSLMEVVTLTDGTQIDSSFVWVLETADGARRVGLLGGVDSLTFNSLPSGPAVFELADVASNCAVTSSGGARRAVTVESTGGLRLEFRIVCSDPTRRPDLTEVVLSYHDGTAGIFFRARDPDRDLERYVWDFTDCQRRSLLPAGPRSRPGLGAGRTGNQDTVTVWATFELGWPDDSAVGRCAALWVVDQQGNQSPVVEQPLEMRSPLAPSAGAFNAHFQGIVAVHTSLQIQDPDGDFVGVFAAARIRDGLLGPPDGVPDLGVFTATGYVGAQVPDLALGGLLTYQDVYGIVVYVFDGAGHFTRLEDDDLFQ